MIPAYGMIITANTARTVAEAAVRLITHWDTAALRADPERRQVYQFEMGARMYGEVEVLSTRQRRVSIRLTYMRRAGLIAAEVVRTDRTLFELYEAETDPAGRAPSPLMSARLMRALSAEDARLKCRRCGERLSPDDRHALCPKCREKSRICAYMKKQQTKADKEEIQ